MFRRDDIRIIIMVIIGMVLLSFLAEVKAADCDKHPIYCQIKANNSELDNDEAMELSNIIYKSAHKNNIPARILAGILMQESGYDLEAKGCHKGIQQPTEKYIETARSVCRFYDPLVPKSNVEGCLKNFPQTQGIEVKICSDFGIGQIYYKTAEAFNLDIQRLTSDLEYSVEAAAMVLADFQKRYADREIDWWTRYNARSKTKRKIYKQLVERYF